MRPLRTPLALMTAALVASACGNTGDAEDLSSSESPPGTGGTTSDASVSEASAGEAGSEPDAAAPDAADTGPDAVDDAEPDVIEPVADPFVPPDIEVTTWRGKLPPGGFFDPAVEVTHPTQPPGAEGYPLVVFAHGFQVGEDMYRMTMEHIAKFGYVAASVDYEGSLVDQDHHAPVEAMALAIDMLTGDPPPEVGPIVDASRIGACGHSIGGKGAVWLTLEDARIRTLVALDPKDDDTSPFPSDKRPSLAPERMDGLTVPALFLGAELSPNGNQPCAPKASNACRFHESVPSGTPSWIVILPNFGHMQFLDPYDCPILCGTCERGPEAEHTARQSIFRGLAVAFFEYNLRGKSGYLDVLEGAGRMQLESDGMLLDPAAQAAFCAPP